MKKVLLLCAKGFETMEFSVFVDVMGWASTTYGCDIGVVTCGLTEQVMSSFNVPVITDVTIDSVNVHDYDALAVPGGFEEFGYYEEAYSPEFLGLIRTFNESGKTIASVCVGALPLAKSGILAGKSATTYHLNNGCRQEQLRGFGVSVVNKPIVISDNVITSYCPQTAPHVAFELLGRLAGEEMKLTVMRAMGY